MSVAIRDYRLDSAAATAYAVFDAADTVGAIITALQAWLAALNAVTGGKITGCRYELEIPLTGGVATKVAVQGANIGRTLLSTFPHAGQTYKYSWAVPGLDPACEPAGALDISDGSSIDVLHDLMEAKLAGTTGGYFVTAAFDHLAPTGSAKPVDRKHRRALPKETPGA
ncbi:MAG TPA: hypothetical protein VGS80_22180 [Ktedonobacterales bacterium]|nr:hypothetical protein [Ktedonobacterales bacterium]